MTALYMLLAAMWSSVRADLWTLGRMVVAALSYPMDFSGDIVS